MKKTFLWIILLLLPVFAWAQSGGTIKGKIFSSTNNAPVDFANIAIQGSSKGTISDENGNYEITGLAVGTYNLQVSYVGFKVKTVYEIEVSLARPTIIDVALEEDATSLQEVEVSANATFLSTDESPNSLKSIGTTEIKRTPGANRDISKVLQSLPGVASTLAFRNDIIIRGGSPNENRFYVDGIEVPTINHFSTQGASGGPVGILNVNLLSDVNFYSGAFPSNRGNTLSSVIEFTQRDGNFDKWSADFVVSATDIGLNFEGPINKNSSINFSVRRSYLQFLFQALQLPFLPTYNDYQLKYKYKFGQKSQLTIISLGALDESVLNLNANKTVEQRYLLNILPINNQWNYTIGAKYEIFKKSGYYTLVVSRSMLNNNIYKYPNNDESLPRIIDYVSQESENKIRFEDYNNWNGWKLNYGINYDYVRYYNNTNNRIAVPFTVSPTGVIVKTFQTELYFNQWGFFAQLSKRFMKERLGVSVGMRLDATDYSPEMSNPLDQFSPRLSLSYRLSERLAWNFNSGIYYQRPSLVVMGYQENGRFVNRDDYKIKYIRSTHFVTGFEYSLPNSNSRITVEGFYKIYENYPFLLRDSISLANLGGDFGVVGNDRAASISEGRSYGLEVLFQRKLTKGIYFLLAYTWVRSEFKDKNGKFVPSSWDNQHIVNFTGGIKFGKNWEFGMRFLFSGGAPFTPFDRTLTLTKSVWDVTGRGVPNNNLLNTARGGVFHSLNMRIDKKWFFKGWNLDVFFDIQNAYAFQTEQQPNIDVVRDANGLPLTDPNNPNLYQGTLIENTVGTPLPSIGVIIEF